MGYQAYAQRVADAYGIPADLFIAQIQQESGFQPRVTSPVGAGGIAQFMPDTWTSNWRAHEELTQQFGDLSDPKNRTNAEASLSAAAALMREYYKQAGGQLYSGNHAGYDKALIAYNAGPGRMNDPIASLPQETQVYLDRIMHGSTTPFPSEPATATPGSQIPGNQPVPPTSPQTNPNYGKPTTDPGFGKEWVQDDQGNWFSSYVPQWVYNAQHPDAPGATGSGDWGPNQTAYYTGQNALDQQRITGDINYQQGQLGNAAQQNANTAWYDQQQAALGAQQNQLTQRQQDLTAQSDAANRALDYYRAQNDNTNTQLAEDHKFRVDQAQLQLQNDQAQWQRASDALTAQVQMRGQDVTQRGQTLDFTLGQQQNQLGQQGNMVNYNLGLGNLALGAAGEDTSRYTAQANANLAQQGNQLTYMGQNLDAATQHNAQLIDQYQAEINAYRAVGDEQGAQAAEARLAATQQQNAALQFMHEQTLANQGTNGLGGAATAATNLALGVGNLQQQRQDTLSQLAANPRDFVQYNQAMGNPLGNLLQGLAPGGGGPGNLQGGTLGPGFDQLVGQLSQNPGQQYIDQASSIIDRLANWSQNPAQGGLTLDQLLALGPQSGQSGGYQLPNAPTSPGIGGAPQMGQFPGLDLTPQWNPLPTFPGMQPIQQYGFNQQPTGNVGQPDVNAFINSLSNPFAGQMTLPPAATPTSAPAPAAAPPPPAGLPPAAPPSAPPAVGAPAPYTPPAGGTPPVNDHGVSKHPGSVITTTGPNNTPIRRDPSKVPGEAVGGGEIFNAPGVDPLVGLPGPKQKLVEAAPKGAHPYGKAHGNNPATNIPWTQAEFDAGAHLKKKPTYR